MLLSRLFIFLLLLLLCGVAIYSRNMNVTFVLQMWKAESLKAGAGGPRSKAAKPRLRRTHTHTHPPWSVWYRAASAWWVRNDGLAGGWGGGGWMMVVRLKGGVTDVPRHDVLHSLPPLSPPRHPLDLQSLSALDRMTYGLLSHVPLSGPRPSGSVQVLTVPPPPPCCCPPPRAPFLCTSCCMASVSRWNPSPFLHADPDLLFFFLVFQKLVFFTFLTCFFLPFLPPSSLFLPGPQRGSSASDQCVRNLVDFNLLWRAAVRNDCISTWLFFFSFLNPGHVLIREKLLLALFFFFFLESRKPKDFWQMLQWQFFFYYFYKDCHVSFSVSDD